MALIPIVKIVFTIGIRASSISYALTVNPIIYTSCIQQFWATAQVTMVNGVRQLQALIDKNKVIIMEASIMIDLHLDDVEGTDCLPNTTIFEELAIMRKEAETVYAETKEEEHFNTPSNDPLPSGEDIMQLNELMALCTQLQQQVLDLEKPKYDQAIEIASLKKRVDKLENRRQLRTTGLTRFKKLGTTRRVKSSNVGLGAQEDASKQGKSIKDIDADAEKNEQSTKLDDSTTSEAVTTASVEDSAAPIIQVSTADIGEVTTAKIDELTLAQTLIEIKAAKPKVITTAATTTTTTRPKGIMVEPEVPLKRKDQIALDEQITRDIQAKLDAELEEEQKLSRKQEEEANIALIESWENTQGMMEADRLLTERL
ncbi:hypothetical protein Tco_0117255 [Tanacetum coccineum]